MVRIASELALRDATRPQQQITPRQRDGPGPGDRGERALPLSWNAVRTNRDPADSRFPRIDLLSPSLTRRLAFSELWARCIEISM